MSVGRDNLFGCAKYNCASVPSLVDRPHKGPVSRGRHVPHTARIRWTWRREHEATDRDRSIHPPPLSHSARESWPGPGHTFGRWVDFWGPNSRDSKTGGYPLGHQETNNCQNTRKYAVWNGIECLNIQNCGQNLWIFSEYVIMTRHKNKLGLGNHRYIVSFIMLPGCNATIISSWKGNVHDVFRTFLYLNWDRFFY